MTVVPDGRPVDSQSLVVVVLLLLLLLESRCISQSNHQPVRPIVGCVLCFKTIAGAGVLQVLTARVQTGCRAADLIAAAAV